MRRPKNHLILLGMILFPAAAHAEVPDTVLYSLAAGGIDGSSPNSAVTVVGSKLYGTTRYGGPADSGALYSFDTASNAYTVLHNFTPGPNGFVGDGFYPMDGLIRSGSTLYGTTTEGGNGSGTIYTLDAATNTYTIVYSFGASEFDAQHAGYNPAAGVTLSGSRLYGGTDSGGEFGWGALYSFDTTSKTVATLHGYAAESGEGIYPANRMTLHGTTLYGATIDGGPADEGNLFSLDTASNVYTVLHNFGVQPGDGEDAAASPIFSGTKFYGTTYGGGASGRGTLYSFDTANNRYTILHSFMPGPNDGTEPVGDLILSGSILYGVTNGGGASNLGTVFAFETANDEFTVLHTFSGGPSDGTYPIGLTLSGSTLYGATENGGASNWGTLFSIQVPEPSVFMPAALAVASLGSRFGKRSQSLAQETIRMIKAE